ncbi:MAG: VWA domain-containing protein [Halioglobus sp.]|nr:VWA domain-containing protein [Halioglobus sp.]
MTRKKRQFNTFNLSFLDIMSCGFGAVVLVYLIMNHAVEQQTVERNTDLLSEVSLLEEDIREGEAGLVRLRNTLASTDLAIVEAKGRATRVSEDRDRLQAELEALRADGEASDDIAARKAELLALEKEVDRLRAQASESGGQSARSFTGDGNRQYLTGLNLGGRHIAILLDTSASMLADRLVQIIRLRNMDASVQRKADKWTRSLATVDWLTAQLPIAANYQVITFNTEARFAFPDTAGKWLEVADQARLEQLSTRLRDILPSGGTSLENAFLALRQLNPQPDNIYLITDGLPTQGTSAPRGSKVSGTERLKLYRQAVRQLPPGVPVNVILAPLEGDPLAASELWQLAQLSKGSFLSPSRDWP